MESRIFHRRNLPHFYPKKGVFFVTWRLKGSIPKKILFEMKLKMSENESGIDRHRKFFKQYDEWLDKMRTGPFHLSMLRNSCE